METLKDIFKDIKDRVSSPFFSSFVISWLIFNYPVVIALVFYKQQELKVDGYKSYLDLIHKSWDSNHMIWHPLLAAMLYTLLFKELLRVIQTNIVEWSTTFILYTTRKTRVSAQTHRASQKELLVKIAEYADSIESEGRAGQENIHLHASLSDLKVQYDELVKNNIKEVSDARNTVMKELQGLQDDLNMRAIKDAALTTELSRSNEMISKLQSDLQILEANNKTNRSTIRDFNQQQGMLGAQLRENSKTIDDLRSELLILNKKLKSKDGELSKAHLMIDDLTSTISDLSR